MFLHIAFKDGSNPYVKYGTNKELKKEIKKWEKNYSLEIENVLRDKTDVNSEVVGYSVVAENKREIMLREINKQMHYEAKSNGEFIPLF